MKFVLNVPLELPRARLAWQVAAVRCGRPCGARCAFNSAAVVGAVPCSLLLCRLHAGPVRGLLKKGPPRGARPEWAQKMVGPNRTTKKQHHPTWRQRQWLQHHTHPPQTWPRSWCPGLCCRSMPARPCRQHCGHRYVGTNAHFRWYKSKHSFGHRCGLDSDVLSGPGCAHQRTHAYLHNSGVPHVMHADC